jgi:hypothetical protein
LKTTADDAVRIIFQSFHHGFHSLAYWILPNLWLALLSIPLVTAPGGKAGLYQAIFDSFESQNEDLKGIRAAFKSGFFRYVWRALGLSAINLLILLVIAFSILFWTRQEYTWMNYLAIVGTYFLIQWWLMQVFLYPSLIGNPELSLIGIFKDVLKIVFTNPFFCLVIAFITTLLTVVGIVLLGPIILVFPSISGLIAIRAYWFLKGVELPDMA